MIISLLLGVLMFYILVNIIDESQNPRKSVIYFFIVLVVICSFLEAIAKGLGLIALFPVMIGVALYGIFK